VELELDDADDGMKSQRREHTTSFHQRSRRQMTEIRLQTTMTSLEQHIHKKADLAAAYSLLSLMAAAFREMDKTVQEPLLYSSKLTILPWQNI